MDIERKTRVLTILDRSVEIALLIIIFTIPFPHHIQTVETLCFIVMFFCWVGKLFLDRELKGTNIDFILFLFIILIAISIFFSIDSFYSLNYFRKFWVKPLFIFYTIVNFINDKRKVYYLTGVVVLSSLGPVIAGIKEFLLNHVALSVGLQSFYTVRTIFARYLDIIIPLIIAIILWNRGKVLRFALGLILISMLFCLAFTYTRTSWVGTFIATCFLCFKKDKRLTLVPLILLGFFLIFSPPTLKKRAYSLLNVNQLFTEKGIDSFTSERFYIWKATVNKIKERPLVGYGLGPKTFRKLYPSFHFEGTDPGMSHVHNYPLEIAFESGILASLIFLWLWITIMVRTWKTFIKLKEPLLKSITIGIFASLITCSIEWLMGIPHIKTVTMSLWTFIGIAMTIEANILEKSKYNGEKSFIKYIGFRF